MTKTHQTLSSLIFQILTCLVIATTLLSCLDNKPDVAAATSDNNDNNDNDNLNTYKMTGYVELSANLQQNTMMLDSDLPEPFSALNTSNNSFLAAQPIDSDSTVIGAVSCHAEDTITSRDSFDFYYASIESGKTISLYIDTDNTEANIDLYLYDKEKERVSTAAFPSNTTENINVTTQTTYFIVVACVAKASAYRLQIENTVPKTNNKGRDAYGMDFVPGEALIKWKKSNNTQIHAKSNKPENNINIQQAILAKHNATESKASSHSLLNFRSITNRQNKSSNKSALLQEKIQTLDIIKALNEEELIEYAEPNYKRYTQVIPNDTDFSKQWHYNSINLPAAWDSVTVKNRIRIPTVAVIDTGVYMDHTDLSANLLNFGYDFISDANLAGDGDGQDDDPNDSGFNWHGTHVAGIIAAETNNNSGVAGVSWGAAILPIRTLNGNGEGAIADIAQAINYATNHQNPVYNNSDVINASFGDYNEALTEKSAINTAISNGSFVVAAAGNDNTELPLYPASYLGVISVGATDAINNRAKYSNFGGFIDVVAPGGETDEDEDNNGEADGVYSTYVSGTNVDGFQSSTAGLQGTSMAAPHVSGIISLMKAAHSELTIANFYTLLASGEITTDLGEPGWDPYYGYGLIDAQKAVAAAITLEKEESWSNENKTLPMLALTVEPRIITIDPDAGSTTTLINISNHGTRFNGTQAKSIMKTMSSHDSIDYSINTVSSNNLGSYNITVSRTLTHDYSVPAKFRFRFDMYECKDPNNEVTINNNDPECENSDTIISKLNQEVYVYIHVLANKRPTLSEHVGSMYMAFTSELNAKLLESHIDLDPALTTRYPFSQDLSAGTYKLIAGSDLDRDGIYCEKGEFCAYYDSPSTNNSINIDRDLTGADEVIITLDYLSNNSNQISPIDLSKGIN